ncbi:MAG: DUF370 domain-containing protein [Leptolyngbyaceae cyanobacterium MAG.088]|nr:DUF370 domain-containing protein [Leptolyngbyaceae cyanobacterium MAG.088]
MLKNNQGLDAFNLGFGNRIRDNTIIAIVSPSSLPIKRLIKNAQEKGVLADYTQGRLCRSVVIKSTGSVILSAIQPDTIAGSSERIAKQK